ncbi:MAG: class I SAM-dependent methyltransferase [Thermomicrobiales bacterium]|nr:class I SAM-dependent methyltransferase [Thermomicrobiales bacterium]
MEIGVWKGDFSRWILEIVRPRKLHLVDPWAFSLAPRDANTWHGGGSAQGQGDMDEIFQAVTARFQAETAAGRVRIHRAMSVDAAATFPDRTFDWIYIDGDHYYDSVKADLESWERTLRPGGIIGGDDYRESPVYGTDVIRAVDEFARARGLAVETFGRQYLMRLPG